MTATLQETSQVGWLKYLIEGEAEAAHCIANIPNPEGALILLKEAFLYIAEGAHAASTLHLGVGATGADVHDIVDGFALNQADGTCWQVVGMDLAEEAALAEPNAAMWEATEYLTMTTAAQVSTGLKAYLFIRYVRLA